MRTITLEKTDIDKGPLILVNKDYHINNKNKIQLVPLNLNHKDIHLESKTAVLLSQLFQSIGCKNEIIPVSGYRSREEQEKIYNDSLLENGSVFTKQYVALPDQSEHQTGLAIDLSENSSTIDFIRPCFPYTGICGAFRLKAPQYGFVERYEKGKEITTGISHEPWHFRYVGYPHSEIMWNNHLSLEEYIPFIKQFPYEGEHLSISQKEKNIEVFFVNSHSDKTSIDLPENDLFQVSGNNVDGFIVTLWRQ